MELNRDGRDLRNLRAPLSALAFVLALSSSTALADSLRWVREANARSAGAVGAVALEAASGSLAFADEAGVWIRVEGASPRRVLRVEGVEDLEFDREGSLWVAAAEGLWRIAVENLGQVGTGSGAEDRSTAPGTSARHVHRLAHAHGWFAAATEAGLYVSFGGRAWQRIDGGAPGGAASAVAFSCEALDRCDMWWVAGSEVWSTEVSLTSDSSQIAVSGTREVRITGAPTGVAPVDVAVGLPSQPVVVVYPQSIASASSAGGEFRIERVVLPPGAELRRLAYGLDRYWLATDRGLMVADELGGAWRRAGVPAGWLAASAVASDAEQLFVGTASGVVRAVRNATGKQAAARPSRAARPRTLGMLERSREELERLHRLALAHVSLDPDRQREWRQRADRRSWWPEVDVQLGYGGSLDRSVDEDQAYVSSAKRQLNDRDRGRGDDWDASLSFKWDLPEAIFDGEVLDVAREERFWIALRDDVLDEINQLYFERRRVMLELAVVADPESIEAARLHLRSEELAAGLDAWTGGAFGSSDGALDHPRARRSALDWQPGRARSLPVGFSSPPTGSRTE